MNEHKINNAKYFNVGLILSSLALALMFLTKIYKDEMLEFGSTWGGWWSAFVDSGYLVILALAMAALAKATNYTKKIWPF